MNREQFLKLVDIFNIEYCITRRNITVSDEPEKIAQFKEICEIFLDSVKNKGLSYTLQSEGYWKEFTLEKNDFLTESQLTKEKFYKLAESLELKPHLLSECPGLRSDTNEDYVLIDGFTGALRKFSSTCELFCSIDVDWSINDRDIGIAAFSIRASIFNEMQVEGDEEE